MPSSILHLHKYFGAIPAKWAAERSRGQPGTIEIGPVEARKLNAPGSHDGFASEHFGGISEGFRPGMVKSGSSLARNFLQRQEGFAREEKVERP